jgi:hypothetical protein
MIMVANGWIDGIFLVLGEKRRAHWVNATSGRLAQDRYEMQNGLFTSDFSPFYSEAFDVLLPKIVVK